MNVQQSDIIQELQYIYESFNYLAERKGVKLLFDPHISSKTLWIDTDKIEKILYNLLSNAIKHTPAKGSIKISTCMLERHEIIQKYGETTETNCNLFMEVTVSDTGSGIPEKKLQDLFIRYRQINDSSEHNHDYSGSGIGLHYTKTLVERHKGKINARIKPENGMEFSFFIPAKDIYSEKEKVKTKKEMYTENTLQLQLTLKNERIKINKKQHYSILIVEDDIELMDFMSNLLSDKYNILEAMDGDQGWDLVQSKSPDLLISDVLMPGLSGYELCSNVKKSAEHCHIPIVLLTAKTSMFEQLEGLELGANAYICKPFNVDYLLLTIHNLLKNKEILRQFFSTPQKTIGEPIPVTLNKYDQMFMDSLTHLIESKLSDPDLNIDFIASELGYSRTVFYRKIKGLTDISPNVFLKNYRLKSAAEKILKDSTSLIEVSEQTGFRSYSYFSKSFKNHFGVTPKEYQNKFS